MPDATRNPTEVEADQWYGRWEVARNQLDEALDLLRRAAPFVIELQEGCDRYFTVIPRGIIAELRPFANPQMCSEEGT